jgi:hypothetical protein
MAYDTPEDYNFQANRPITKYYESLRLSCMPIFFRFLSYQCLMRGTDGIPVKVAGHAYFLEFDTWKKERGFDAPYTSIKFGKEMTQMDTTEKSGISKSKSGLIRYEITFDVLRNYLIDKKLFDDNAF